MTANAMWDAFIRKENIVDADYEVWAFGGEPDELAELVRCGIKTGTASAYPLYEVEDEPLPKAGEYSVILDSEGEAVCVIKDIRVYIVPFNQVSEGHAYKEGEGDRSLDYWRQVHRELFTKWLAEAGLEFDEEIPVVCEEFEVVYRPDGGTCYEIEISQSE